VMNAGATAPEWASPTTAGWTSIEDDTSVGSVTVVDITDLGDYEEIEIFLAGLKADDDSKKLSIWVSDDNGSTFETAGYLGAVTTHFQASTFTWFAANGVWGRIKIVQIGSGRVELWASFGANASDGLAISNSIATGSKQFATFDNGSSINAIRFGEESAETFTAGSYDVRAK